MDCTGVKNGNTFIDDCNQSLSGTKGKMSMNVFDVLNIYGNPREEDVIIISIFP